MVRGIGGKGWRAAVVAVFLFGLLPRLASADFSARNDSATGSFPVSVALADLNGDGKLDVITANAASVSFLRNTTPSGNSTPTFAFAGQVIPGSSPRSVAVADLNGDGKPDLAVANQGSDSVSVFLNETTTGATSLTFHIGFSFSTQAGPVSVALADLNGDGRLDIVAANRLATSVSMLLNTTSPGDSTPSFAAEEHFAAGNTPRWVAAADLNGDGKPDVVTANEDGNSVSVLLNNVAPGATSLTGSSFSAKTDFATGSAPVSVALADLNGDGKPDIVTANSAADTASVLINATAAGAGTASFNARTDVGTGPGPTGVALGDTNGDDRPEIASPAPKVPWWAARIW